jgi:hypothetical protein
MLAWRLPELRPLANHISSVAREAAARLQTTGDTASMRPTSPSSVDTFGVFRTSASYYSDRHVDAFLSSFDRVGPLVEGGHWTFHQLLDSGLLDTWMRAIGDHISPEIDHCCLRCLFSVCSNSREVSYYLVSHNIFGFFCDLLDRHRRDLRFLGRFVPPMLCGILRHSSEFCWMFFRSQLLRRFLGVFSELFQCQKLSDEMRSVEIACVNLFAVLVRSEAIGKCEMEGIVRWIGDMLRHGHVQCIEGMAETVRGITAHSGEARQILLDTGFLASLYSSLAENRRHWAAIVGCVDDFLVNCDDDQKLRLFDVVVVSEMSYIAVAELSQSPVGRAATSAISFIVDLLREKPECISEIHVELFDKFLAQRIEDQDYDLKQAALSLVLHLIRGLDDGRENIFFESGLMDAFEDVLSMMEPEAAAFAIETFDRFLRAHRLTNEETEFFDVVFANIVRDWANSEDEALSVRAREFIALVNAPNG